MSLFYSHLWDFVDSSPAGAPGRRIPADLRDLAPELDSLPLVRCTVARPGRRRFGCLVLAAAGKAARVNGDAWSDLLPAIARHLLGDPPAIEADGSWRYGKRGSLAVHVDGPRRGTFRDFEAGKSGGVLDLVLHLVEHVNARTAAAAWLRAEGLLAPHDPQTPVKRRTPVHPFSGPGPERERQRDDADARALAYAQSIWSATVQAGEVDAVRRYLARRWCWPPCRWRP